MTARCQFDNLNDIHTKFVSTIIYYDGVPMYVKDCGCVQSKENPEVWTYHLVVSGITGCIKSIDLNNDPNLSYRDYAIGYANSSEAAIWWYRRAVRQWRQGLRRDQLSWHSHYSGYVNDDFTFSKSIVMMLSNSYPTILSAEEILRTEKRKIVAFHKDFALQPNAIRGDFTLEYRGKPVGFTQNLKDFKLVDNYSYLTEHLSDAIEENSGVHASHATQ
jgi:hypothetical protein